MPRFNFRRPRLLLVLTALLFPATVRAQTEPDWATQHLWTAEFDVISTPETAPAPRQRPNRIPLFRIVPGFLSDPVGLDADDPRDATPDTGPDWLQVSMGNYNPFFDFRRPGDPGGVGFYKLHSQVQLFDNGATGLALAVQAVTPAGLEQDGVENGATVFSPSLCLFHTFDDGTSIQSFIGKNMEFHRSSFSGRLHRNMQYGVAVERPVLETGEDNFGSFYLFVEALGRYRYDGMTTGAPAVWEMVPGVHWRVTENVWLSGGVLMPVGASPFGEARLWQLTCSFQF